MDTLFKETETKSEVVKVNASDYGVEESKAQEIEAMFKPMLAKMTALETEYNEILKLEINGETCAKAKELRLVYVKVRTGTAEIHKKAKEFYLNMGRLVDGWKNVQLAASGEKEKTLKAIEDHFENLERERTEKLRVERLNLLKPYTDIEPLALGHMEQAVFDNTLLGFKTAYEVRIAAEKKAEEDRIAREKAEAEERERQRLENIRLRKEAEEREAQMKAEREKAEAERKELEAKARKEAEERAKIQAALKAKEEAEAKAIRDAEVRFQAELKAKKDAEKKARLAPDKDKLLAFGQALNDVPRPEIKSIEAAEIMVNINGMLSKLNEYIIANANKL